LTLPLPLTNGGNAESYGFEVTTNYEVQDAWRLRTSYSYIDMRDTASNVAVYDSARNIAYLQSSWDILGDWELDLIYRYVDSLPRLNVPSYNTMDVRVSWIPTTSFELSVVGRNLLDGQHPEFANDVVTGNVATEVQREMYVIANWRY
jgi:iron complex outermembrane receptor protein